MSLPIVAIDRLFARLHATYGAAWDRAMGSVPVADAKAAWAHELGGFAFRSDPDRVVGSGGNCLGV